MSTSAKLKILFICMGNTCRSPIAEAVFIKAVKNAKRCEQWEIDSAGLYPWYIGQQANPRALEVLKNHNINYNNVTRQITEDDFRYYDYIFAMDMINMSELGEIAPENTTARLILLGDFDPEGDRIIRDPFFDSDSSGFEKCFQQATRCCKAILEKFS